MKDDPIVEEVRKHRDQFSAKHHYDFDEIYCAIKVLERKNKALLIPIRFRKRLERKVG